MSRNVRGWISAATEDRMVQVWRGQEDLAKAFKYVTPTDALMFACYEALAKAHVQPLPVQRRRRVVERK
jgi:hypothetical protein